MMMKAANREVLSRKMLAMVLIFTLLNTGLLGWSYNNIRHYFPSEATRLNYKQEAAQDLVKYNERLAQNLGVAERTTVREALAGFKYDLELATSSDELTQVILNQGRRVQETILREADAKFKDEVLAIVNHDENVQLVEEEQVHLTIRITMEEVTTVPANFLSAVTINRIRELYPMEGMAAEQIVEIDILNGEGRLSVPYNPVEHIQSLSDELDKLRVSMHELRTAAGMAEMTGPGVVVKLSDAVGGMTTASIIHDADIRDVVNELFASGAMGVSVGGQRLIATSFIRCSGSLVKVNDRLIAVNPVEISAVGDPELLSSGLDIIRTGMEVRRGIRFEIIPMEKVTLPAYVRGER